MCVYSDRHQLAQLVDCLRNNTQRTFGEGDKEKDDRSSVFTGVYCHDLKKKTKPERLSKVVDFVFQWEQTCPSILKQPVVFMLERERKACCVHA